MGFTTEGMTQIGEAFSQVEERLAFLRIRPEGRSEPVTGGIPVMAKDEQSE